MGAPDAAPGSECRGVGDEGWGIARIDGAMSGTGCASTEKV